MNCSSLVKDRRGSQTRPICVDSDGEDEETRPKSPKKLKLDQPAQFLANQPEQEDKEICITAFFDWLVANAKSCIYGDEIYLTIPLSEMGDSDCLMRGYTRVMDGVTGLCDIDNNHVNKIVEKLRKSDNMNGEWEFYYRSLYCKLMCSVLTWFRMVGQGDYARLLTDMILRYCLVDVKRGQITSVDSTLIQCVNKAINIVKNLPESVLNALHMESSHKTQMIQTLCTLLGEALIAYEEERLFQEHDPSGNGGRYKKRDLYRYVDCSNCWNNSIKVFGRLLDGYTGDPSDWFKCYMHGNALNPEDEYPFQPKIDGLKTKSVRHWPGERYDAFASSVVPDGMYHVDVKYLEHFVECLQHGYLHKILRAELVVDIHYACADNQSTVMQETYRLYEGECKRVPDLCIEGSEGFPDLSQEQLSTANLLRKEPSVNVYNWEEEVRFNAYG